MDHAQPIPLRSWRAFELEAEFAKEVNRRRKVFDDDSHVVHPFERHLFNLEDVGDRDNSPPARSSEGVPLLPAFNVQLTARVDEPPAQLVKEIRHHDDRVRVGTTCQISTDDDSVAVRMQVEGTRSGAFVDRLLRPLLRRGASEGIPLDGVGNDHQVRIW